jgi:hypothetical protein
MLVHGAEWIGGAVLAACLVVPAALLAQMPTPGAPTTMPPSATPKFPTLPSAPGASAPGPARPSAPAAAPARPGAPAAGGAAAAQPGKPGAEGRDPFEPLVTVAPEGENRPSLSGLRLAGVVWDPVRRELIRALVETPDGLGYYVRMNEEKFGGKVVAIERDLVRFTVREQDPSGQTRVRTVELKLSQ